MRLLTSALLFAGLCASALAQTSTPPYENPSLTPEARAHDLVSRMTLAEKVSQMGSGAAAIPRLNVPAYNYWNEALHGVARSGYATMFPQAIGMAATWDMPLLHQIGDVISTEARAKNNNALAHGNHDIYFGLTFWSPNVNIFRDPRWGRGQETYGEDPFLTGQLALNFIEGLQGNNPKYFKVIATPKHFAVHSGPEDIRHKFNVDPTPHDLWDTYLPQFREAIVEAKADSIMCSYNAVDNEPACGSKLLLQDILRRDWHFQGFVTSDCGAIDDFFKPNTHQTEPDAEHADRDALLAGTDTNCGATYERLGAAVQQGLVKESDIDRSLERLFEARIRLGLFDPKSMVPYTEIPFSEVHSPANAEVARHAAEESMVLLKNNGVLPLAPGQYKTIAVIGPNAAMLDSLEGNYHGTPHDPMMPVDALRAAMPGSNIVYQQGAPFVDGFALPVPRTMLHPTEGSSEQGLHAEYFGNPNFSGSPVKSGIDPQINFNWDGVNPLPGTPDSGLSVRWTGTLSAPRAGSYNFTLRAGPCRGCAAEQSFKVLIDGQQVAASDPPTPDSAVVNRINGTTGLPEEAHQQHPVNFTVNFADGQQHKLQIDFARQTAANGTGVTLDWTPPVDLLLPSAVESARKSDLIVAMLGLSPNLEGEEMPVKLPGFNGGDRTDINLPASQQKLLEQLVATGKPLVVVLLNGSAISVNYADQHANAILEAWYPGEAGGKAIADTLLGTNNPAGRLPLTFYASENDLPPFTDYSMKNRTYRYFTGKPLYSFGYGLSYTSFAYSGLKLSTASVHAGQPLTVEAELRNTGKRAGDEVAELYLTPPADGNGGLSPRIQLEGVQRVHLAPGESRHLSFTLDARQLSEVDAQGNRSVQPGRYTVSVGGAQPGDARSPEAAQRARFSISGTEALPH
jgi:beta-glucosidase